MRIGTVILILLLALFSSGFLLNHSMHLTEELSAYQEQLGRLQIEKQTLEAQYQALLEERNRLDERVVGLTVENEDLHSEIDALQAERRNLNDQISALQIQVQAAQAATPLLTGLATASPGRIALALLIVPILPLSMGTLYIMTRSKARPIVVRPRNPNIDQETIQTALTREELHLIAQRRRSKAG